jgi:origin recognition complex subunit 3
MKQQDGTILIQLHLPCSTVFARVHSLSLIPDNSRGWLNEGVYEPLVFIWTARAALQKHSKLLRASFPLFLLVQQIMVSLGYKSDKTLPELMCGSLRGHLGSSPMYLCTIVK